MSIAIFRATVVAAPEPPFVGTRIRIRLDDPGSLTWGMKYLVLAEGRERGVIDWGDGTGETIVGVRSEDITHGYARTGEYEVRISDDVAEICANSNVNPFHDVYGKAIREFRTNATRLGAVSSFCFRDADNLGVVRCEGSGLRAIRNRAFANCPSLCGRLDLPGVDELSTYSFLDSTGITELHFSAANEAAIRALAGFATAFGAANATIFFDP